MKLYGTEIIAIKPSTHQLTTYGGPNVPGLTKQMAQQYCEENGLGYCRVLDELVAEIPLQSDGAPDWQRMVDYEQPSLN